MSTASDEFEPPEEVLRSVLAACIAPQLEELESELGRRVAGRFEVWVQTGRTQLHHLVVSQAADALEFEGRVRFRRTGSPDRSLFSVQIKFAEAPGGFSGFAIRGAIEASNALATDHMVLHGAHGWLKW